jgi:hypothetical protein
MSVALVVTVTSAGTVCTWSTSVVFTPFRR